MADNISLTNQYGTVAISDMAGTGGLGTIGSTTITSKGSQLTQWNSYTGHLGTVAYATGALQSGSISGGGVFAGGGYFDIVGIGAWAKKLTGETRNPIDLFTGSFNGPVDWTLVSQGKSSATYNLTGAIVGTIWTGRLVNGTTTQSITIDNKGQLNQGIGHINMGGTGISTPEPGTLGLLGTGLVAVAGMFRRKLIKG
jgi:hypothetical protein